VLDPRQVELLLGRIRTIRDFFRYALIASAKYFAEPLDDVGWNDGHFKVSCCGLTLPLSGRRGAWGGGADGWWWPVHSKGLFECAFSSIQA